MKDLTMGSFEAKFADMIWAKAPVSSTVLWQECAAVFGWKKTTTFTVLKRLCDKGLFRNEKGTVIANISREDFFLEQSAKLIDASFGGSLPAFIAAFIAKNDLSKEEKESLKKMVDEFKED